MLTRRLCLALGGALGAALAFGGCEQESVYDQTPTCARACPDGTNIVSTSSTLVDPSRGQFAFVSGECETICQAAEPCRAPNVPTVAIDPMTGGARYSCKPLEGFSTLPPASETDLSFGAQAGDPPADLQLAVGSLPGALAAGDLDGDGDDDLVVANEGASDLSVLASNGDGTFEAELRVPLPGRAYALALPDLDGDGRRDLLVAHATPGQPWAISGALSASAGGFGELTPFGAATDPSPTGPVKLAVGTFDSGPGEDVVVAGFPAHGSTTVFLGDDSGSVSSSRELDECEAWRGGASCSVIYAGQFDDDPATDLAFLDDVASGSTRLHVLHGVGDGTWTALRTVQTLGTRLPVYDAVITLELSAPGSLDLAFVSGSAVAVALLPFGSNNDPDSTPAETSCPQAPLVDREVTRLGRRSVARLLPECRRLGLWHFDAVPSIAEVAVDLPEEPGALVAAEFIPGSPAAAVSLPAADSVLVVFP